VRVSPEKLKKQKTKKNVKAGGKWHHLGPVLAGANGHLVKAP
jgi:hypothetical protein